MVGTSDLAAELNDNASLDQSVRERFRGEVKGERTS